MGIAGDTEEVNFKSTNGYSALLIAVLSLVFAAACFGQLIQINPLWGALGIIVFAMVAKGLYMLQPNQAALMMLFGGGAAAISLRTLTTGAACWGMWMLMGAGSAGACGGMLTVTCVGMGYSMARASSTRPSLLPINAFKRAAPSLNSTSAS